MADPMSIAPAEWRVMQVVWDQSPITGTEVAQQLAAETGWSPRTVKTLLSRLVRKKVLAYSSEGNRYLYKPAVTRTACIRAASRSFVDRVFGGDATLMLTHLVKQSRLNPDEIAELKRLLEGKDT